MADTPDRRAGARARTTAKAPAGAKRIEYGPKISARICASLAEGQTWQEICRQKGMPAYSTLYAWRRKHADFADAVDAARAMGAEYCLDLAVEVATGSTRESAMMDRLKIGALTKRATLTGPRKAGGKSAKAEAEPVEVIFRVRHFEKVIGPDGKAFVREIEPEDAA